MAVQPGARFGRYSVRGVLGKGGFATVYRAWDEALHREVALKALLPNLADDPSVVERFLGEARILAGFHHPNIVTVFDVGEAHGAAQSEAQTPGWNAASPAPPTQPFFAMELVDGQTLAQRFPFGTQVEPAEAARILGGLGAAVDYLHRLGLVHRDIKPPNVMLDAADRVVLMDFGIARALDHTQLTRTGVSLGTPEYMAPEQVRGETVGPAADIYAMGVLAYRLFAGQSPFTGDTGHVLYAHAHEPPPSLAALRPGLPPAVYRAIDAALAKNPAERPASGAAFVSALADNAPPSRIEATQEETTPIAVEAPWRTRGAALNASDRATNLPTEVVSYSPAVAAAPPGNVRGGPSRGRVLLAVAAGAVIFLAAAGGAFALVSSRSSNSGKNVAGRTAPTVVPISNGLISTSVTAIATPTPAPIGAGGSLPAPSAPAALPPSASPTRPPTVLPSRTATNAATARATVPPSATATQARTAAPVAAVPTVVPPPANTGTGQTIVVTKPFGAALRVSPSSDAQIAMIAACASRLPVSQVGDGWYQVSSGGRLLWVGGARVADAAQAGSVDCSGGFAVQIGAAVLTQVASGCLSLRDSPSRSASFTTCVDNGHRYTVQNGPIDVNGEDWFLVTSPSTGSGWVLAQFLLPG